MVVLIMIDLKTKDQHTIHHLVNQPKQDNDHHGRESNENPTDTAHASDSKSISSHEGKTIRSNYQSQKGGERENGGHGRSF
jgi:hypothetical protein